MSIDRIETDVVDEDYIEYLVVHDDGSMGSADLRIMTLDEDHYMARWF